MGLEALHSRTHSHLHQLLQEGTPSRARNGSCLPLGNELSKETRADKARGFIGEGRPGGEQEGEGAQESCSAAWLAVSGFMVMGLVSGWSSANHSNSESFLVVHASFSQDLARGILESGRTCGASF